MTLKEGYYWVSQNGCEPEIMLREFGSWLDMSDDPSPVPDRYVTVLRGPLRPPRLPSLPASGR